MISFLEKFLPRYREELASIDENECPFVYNNSKGHVDGAEALLKLIEETALEEIALKVNEIVEKARSDSEKSCGEDGFYNHGIYAVTADFLCWIS